MLIGLLSDKPPYRKFLILVSLILFFTIIFSLIGGLIVSFLFGINILDNSNALNDLNDPNVIASMKVLQLVTTGLGMFLIPSLVSTILFYTKPKSAMGLNKIPGLSTVVLVVLIMFASVPVINLLLVLNEQFQLPEFLSFIEQWMKSSEEQAARITESFLIMNSSGDLLINLFIIALMPAIGEELLFRGILQKLFSELTKNIHISIFITAALFSAIHMQFYGFLPRMFLGVLFGYMLIWTGTIWVPVIAHFINNAAAVIFSYYASRKQLPFDQDTIGTGEDEILFAVISVIVVGVLVFIMRNYTMQKLPNKKSF